MTVWFLVRFTPQQTPFVHHYKSSRLRRMRLWFHRSSLCCCLIRYWYTVTVRSTQIQTQSNWLRLLSSLPTLQRPSVLSLA
ncbi:Uncharacterised protein [Vibrio cholerae]|nr:Uncharacterised protein [Vibrio cholerae]CSI44446.1 Uncharacterised protein [Vibrio cholerae]